MTVFPHLPKPRDAGTPPCASRRRATGKATSCLVFQGTATSTVNTRSLRLHSTFHCDSFLKLFFVLDKLLLQFITSQGLNHRRQSARSCNRGIDPLSFSLSTLLFNISMFSRLRPFPPPPLPRCPPPQSCICAFVLLRSRAQQVTLTKGSPICHCRSTWKLFPSSRA
jgi:hypothetical protein